MIKVEELMLGNFVNYKGTDYKVWSISNSSTPNNERYYICLDNEYLDKHLKGINFLEINPIPLTEEWLLRFGFMKDHKKYNPSILDTITFWNSGLGFKSIINGTRFRLEIGNDATVFSSGINIDYVHTLQNLFFSLTGEKLTLKDENK